jgi:integrase
MRPSEASALTWADVDLEAGTISVSKSRYMGSESAPKTSGSARTIQFGEPVLNVLKILPSRELWLSHVFVNKFGEPMNAKKWSEHNWGGPLKTLGIRHRKFYATRHTFIMEAIKRGESPLAVAQYCGTSLAMIQADYCGTLGLRLDQTVFEPQVEKALKIWLRGRDLNPGPQGYEPCELPDCSTPRQV